MFMREFDELREAIGFYRRSIIRVFRTLSEIVDKQKGRYISTLVELLTIREDRSEIRTSWIKHPFLLSKRSELKMIFQAQGRPEF